MARDIIDSVPIIDADHGADFVFSLDGRKPLNSWSKNKMKLDELMREALMREALPDMLPWQLRDLRRTARTLMSRAGVQTEVSERALGHVMTTIRGTYDRYDYLPQKREAFDKLAAWVERIVNPPEGSNVRRLPGLRPRPEVPISASYGAVPPPASKVPCREPRLLPRGKNGGREPGFESFWGPNPSPGGAGIPGSRRLRPETGLAARPAGGWGRK